MVAAEFCDDRKLKCSARFTLLFLKNRKKTIHSRLFLLQHLRTFHLRLSKHFANMDKALQLSSFRLEIRHKLLTLRDLGYYTQLECFL
ncbi:uncharacterized protein LOC127048993 isoform X3 [Gopherus flavomarginatus]|uniref:uncharacterized protein LOC127048993 isoform X3 n=1 Tax=Gopherus flavomarginatus TaxID=286002 RepID=UPI0021CC4D6A|nr:uncharacterized protein LOC127048993 isoform X3 [Gopherus flavomarginatus]